MRFKKNFVFIPCFLLLSLTTALTCYANPDSLPFVTVVVDNAPSDMEITIGKSWEFRKHKIGRETQFTYYGLAFSEEKVFQINVTTNGKTTEYTIAPPLSYKNIYKLNLKDNTLTNAKSPLRYIRLVIIYVLLTLLLEGVIFYIFGFRKKRSWIAFVVINIITQGLLHIWTDSPHLFDRLIGRYGIGGPFGIENLILGLVSGEIIVFLVEIIAFATIVKEKPRTKRIAYALAANAFSLALGWFVLSFIPV